MECNEPGISPVDINPSRDVWTFDFRRGTPTRITGEGSIDSDPAWSPDGTQIVYSSGLFDGKGVDIYRTNASGGGISEPVFQAPLCQYVCSWWPGKYITYVDDQTSRVVAPDSGIEWGDLFMLEGSRPKPLVTTRFSQTEGQLAPNSEYLLYPSTDTGKLEVYVRSIKDIGGQWTISTGGGYKPRWRPDGGEIYYLAPDKTLMAVPVSWEGGFKPGRPAPLFKTSVVGPKGYGMRYAYAVTKNGQRFLMYEGDPSPSLAVVVNAVQ